MLEIKFSLKLEKFKKIILKKNNFFQKNFEFLKKNLKF